MTMLDDDSVTGFQESDVLLAVVAEDDDRARRILAEMLAGELQRLVLQALRVRQLAGEEYVRKTDTEDVVFSKQYPGFTVTCDRCGSPRVLVDSDLGFSATSGTWGSVDLTCDDCPNSVELFSDKYPR